MRFFSGVLLLPCFVASVFGIFKDDAYHTDWHIPLIGPSLPTSTFFHQPNPDSKASLIYSLTDRSILAAINPKDGELVWRQQLKESAVNVARAGNGVVVSATGTSVSSFHAGNGRLVWENAFSQNIVDLRITPANKVAVLFADGVVRLLDDKSGDVAWEWMELDRCANDALVCAYGDANFLRNSTDVPLSLHVTKSTLTVASQSLKKLWVSTIDLATGKSTSSTTHISTAADIPAKHQAHHGDELLSWTEESGRTLKFVALPSTTPASVAIPNDVVETVLLSSKDNVVVHFKTHGESWAHVYKVDSKGVASEVYAVRPRLGAHSAISLNSAGGKTYLVWTLPNGETVLYDVAKEEALASYTLTNATEIDPRHSVSEVVPRPDGTSFAVRTFVSSAAHGFVGDSYLIRNGELAWSRKESLVSVVASTWIELLDPSTEEIVEELDAETHKSVGAAYVHRVTRHLNELSMYGPAWVQALPQRILGGFVNKGTEMPTGKWRDFFGFRKFAIVITAEGGVAAIDVGRNGEVVWQASLVNAGEKFQGVSGIYEVRKGHVGIVCTGGSYVEYNGFDGIEVLKQDFTRSVLSTAQVDTRGGKKAIIALLSNNKAIALPMGVDTEFDSVHLTIKDSTRSIKGIRVSPNLVSSPTWTFVPPAGESITTIEGRPAHDPVASIGRVLGDRSVMYKYLNPHMIVISTVNPTAATASIYLIDSVSGSILHSATHAAVDVTQPVVATVSENWVIYSYFSDEAAEGTAKGYHLVVLELYESEFKNDRGSLADADKVSSFKGAGKPHVLSQSYIFPSAVNAFAVTVTKQGIASRDILALLPGTQGIYSIPKRVLDPRRPVGREPDAAEKEEGLFIYTPVIEIDPKSIITHKRKVMGLKKVVTTPSQLESTSIVFAYGGDLFGTRVAPSLAFDVLGKGFGKIQLVATVVGLTIASFMVAPMVRKKQINARWSL
jgi:hypothetical protein